MKKELLSLALLTGLVVAPTFAKADENKTVDGNVTLKTPTTAPLDPPDIEPPVGPYDPSNELLRISAVTPLDFGNVTLTSSLMKPVAQLFSSEGKDYYPGVLVEDLRGTGTGWNLTVGLSTFAETTEGGELKENGNTLKGVQLVFPTNVTPETVSDSGIVVSNVQPEYTAGRLEANGNGTHRLLSAGIDRGMGAWQVSFAPKDQEESGLIAQPLTLEIPANNKIGSYQSTITWTVADGPTAP